MKLATERFYRGLPDASDLMHRERIEYFAYFLQEELGKSHFTTKEISQCFDDCSLSIPTNIAQVLSRGTAEKPPLFLKAPTGYRLERHFKDELARTLVGETHTVHISPELRKLEHALPDGLGKKWFSEALDCFSVEGYRASMMMTWIYTLDHLFNYVLSAALAEFNAALDKHSDQKTVKKIGLIQTRDNFTLLGEEMFIEVCRSANVISPDVRKILIEKLGTRNSIAHPSGITVSRAKVVEFTEDLIQNVVLKYPVIAVL